MKRSTAAIWGCALLAGALTVSTAQAQQGSNAATTQGSGAVGTTGTGGNPDAAGIGSNASSSHTMKSTAKKGAVKRHPATTGSTRMRSSTSAPMKPTNSNAVVNKGSGAVNPLGPGESSGSTGVGGSGTSAPPQ
jgi:hypothetical protein